MAIHAITLVGGDASTLPHWIAHYQRLGVDSCIINLHVPTADDPLRDEVQAIAKQFGITLAAVYTGNWQEVQRPAYLAARESRRNDWFLIADADELQQYPGPIDQIVRECDTAGFDYIRGCFVDRFARDGSFPPVQTGIPIGEQFPLGGILSLAVAVADPRKVVAVRGPVPLRKGNHHALAGTVCPARYYYIPVHHYKWTAGVLDRLAARAESLRVQGYPQWEESARFVQHLRRNGDRVNAADPRLLAGECNPDYPHWERVKKLALQLPMVEAT